MVEAVEDRRAAKEQADNRKELFGRAQKPNRPGKRDIDKVEVKEDTSLSKMKADLFAVPAKKKQAEDPAVAPAPALEADEMDMDDFKAALFQSAGGAPPAAASIAPAPAPASIFSPALEPEPVASPVRAAPRAARLGMPEEKFVEADPEMRNALFAAPTTKKKKAAPAVVNPFASSPTPGPAATTPAPGPVPTPTYAASPAHAAEEKGVVLRMDLLTPKNLQPNAGVEELYEGDLLSDDEDEDSDGLC